MLHVYMLFFHMLLVCTCCYAMLCCLCMFMCMLGLICFLVAFAYVVVLLYVACMHVCLMYMLYFYLLYMFSQVCEVFQQVQKAYACIGARFCFILLLITLKVRFRIKYRILYDIGFVLAIFSRVGYPHHLQMRCIFVFFVSEIFPVEPRKGGAAEIFRKFRTLEKF